MLLRFLFNLLTFFIIHVIRQFYDPCESQLVLKTCFLSDIFQIYKTEYSSRLSLNKRPIKNCVINQHLSHSMNTCTIRLTNLIEKEQSDKLYSD